MWMLNSREKLAATPYMTLVKDNVTSPSGKPVEYFHMKVGDGVIVVPIRVGQNGEVSFVMVQQYRYPVGKFEYEFPGGLKEPSEAAEVAARRELLEETGYEAKKIKFAYVINSMPGSMSSKIYVYTATIEGEPKELKLDDSEADFGLVVKEFSSDQLLKLVTDNEVTDAKTVAALAVVLLQSPKALEYANSINGDI